MALSTPMVGSGGDVGARGLGFETLAEWESNGQLTYYVRGMALRSVAYARRVTVSRVEGSWKAAARGNDGPFLLLGGDIT